MSGFMNSDDLL